MDNEAKINAVHRAFVESLKDCLIFSVIINDFFKILSGKYIIIYCSRDEMFTSNNISFHEVYNFFCLKKGFIKPGT